ncbi:Curli production assembly/transport component CsgG [Winogradskyella forsetii]|uniref:Curli production assembly/transport component CsgG n=1 Tax=Winogradskyella forsetii TaxID=2686077 RepID=UPI001E3CD059|nr:Curli production assembly/transport component CsgG [Winogradskyella forsetii]
MISKFNAIIVSIAVTIFSFNSAFSQVSDEKSDKSIERRYAFFNLRGSNAIDIAAGSAMIEGDYPETEFDLYFKMGYKHHITSHLNINFSYHKYNVVVKDIYNEGFMSFDLNLEFLFSPYTKFSPFLYAGSGYNASNYFENTATKAQGGAGFEFIFTEGVGVKLFGEYNYMFTDELDGLVDGDSDDILFRAGLGLNFYFGGNKKKEALRRKMKTVINSNQIIPYK